jgi:hypothetical protein
MMQQVHDEVDLGGDHREDPVRAGHVRDERVGQRDDRGDQALGDQDVLLHAVLVEALQERRQVALFTGDQQQAA